MATITIWVRNVTGNDAETLLIYMIKAHDVYNEITTFSLAFFVPFDVYDIISGGVLD